MAKDFSTFDTKTTLSNVSGSSFNANIQILSGLPYLICINSGITSNIVNQVLSNAQADITTIANYNTSFLTGYTATQLTLKGLLFTNQSLTIQDFFDYINGSLPLISTTGDQYYQIVNNSIYAAELIEFNLLINNLQAFVNLINTQLTVFAKYFDFFNIYNNFENLFNNTFYTSSYSNFTTSYSTFIANLRQTLTVAGQIYLTTNDANSIKINDNFFTITKISFGNYYISLNSLSLPSNTTVIVYNNLYNIKQNILTDITANATFGNQEILSNFQDKNIINSVDVNQTDYIILPIDKTLIYSFLLDGNTKKISLISQNSNIVDPIDIPSQQTIPMTALMARVLLGGEAANIDTNFNYYTNAFLEDNVPEYKVGCLRLSNIEIDSLYPDYYIRVSNQIVNITNIQTLYNQCLASINFSLVNSNTISITSINHSLFIQNGVSYEHQFLVGATFILNNSNIVTITGISNGNYVFNTSISGGDILQFLEHPCLSVYSLTQVKITCIIQDNLPLAGISNGNIFSDNQNNNIVLQQSNIPSFNYFGANTSFFGEPIKDSGDASNDIIPANGGVTIREIMNSGSENGIIGNLNPTALSVSQNTAIIYKMFIKLI